MEKEVEIENEKIFLKGSKGNWRIIHPIRIDGKIVWKNLIAGGSWWNLLVVGIVVVLILGAINEYTQNLKLAGACLRALPDYVDLSLYIKNPQLNSSVIFP
jgi:hypothetical protein